MILLTSADNEDSAGNEQGKNAWQRREAFKEVGEGTMSLRSKTLHPRVFGRAKPCTSGFRGARLLLLAPRLKPDFLRAGEVFMSINFPASQRWG